MEKYLKATEILLPRGNKANCPIYKYENKFYIRANKPNTQVYNSFFFNGLEYSEVKQTNTDSWYLA